jgi:hypothetical protein
METLKQLSDLMNCVAFDERCRPAHLSLYMALCNCWINNHFKKFFNISRRHLMKTSHIQSTATYHRIINDLRDFGYLQYHPSYHPKQGSIVSLIGGAALQKREVDRNKT